MLKRKPSVRPCCDGDLGQEDDHHEKNPYKNRPPDFAKLAAKYPDLLGHFVRTNKTTGRGSLDFTDMEAAKALTKTLLLHDFGLKVEILKGHLCPPLPNRINYLCWLSDLINATASLSSGENIAANANKVRVLDIGVGPVGIYPLLGHALFGWSFVGSDVDADAIQHCQRNIDANPQLAGSVSLVLVSGSAELQERIARDYLPGLSNASLAAQSPLHLMHTSDQHSNTTTITTAADCQNGPIVQAIRFLGLTRDAGIVKLESDGSAESAEVEPAQPTFQAVMCNPPFYDCDEKVSDLLRCVSARYCAMVRARPCRSSYY
jgi:23S rRNA A1618 N6-methylase RlmF